MAKGVREGVSDIKNLADVRPGDLYFTNIGGFVPGVFPVKAGQLLLGERVRIGARSFDHVGIVVEAAHHSTAEAHMIADGFDVPIQLLDSRYAPRAVQAMPRGAEEIALTSATHWNERTTFFRLPEDYPGQAQDAAAIARLFVSEKVPYSFLSYAALAAWKVGIKAQRLERWIDRRGEPQPLFTTPARATGYQKRPVVALPREAICSVLVDQAWSLAGKRVMDGVARQCVTPGALAMRLWARDVQRFGVGIG